MGRAQDKRLIAPVSVSAGERAFSEWLVWSFLTLVLRQRLLQAGSGDKEDGSTKLGTASDQFVAVFSRPLGGPFYVQFSYRTKGRPRGYIA